MAARSSSTGRSVGASAALAPRSGSIVRSPVGSTITTTVPVARTGSIATRVCTPRARRSSTATRPARSLPTRRRAGPARRAPPAARRRWRRRRRRCVVICDGVSEACASGPRRPRDHVGHQVADDDDGHAASATATCAASSALRSTIRMFARRLSPPVSAWKCASRNGVMSRAADALALGGRERRRRARARADRGRAARRRAAGWRPRARCRSAELVGGEQRGGDLLRRVEPPRHRVAGVGEVEAGEAVGPVAGDADAERLQPLERGAARRGSTSPPRRRRRCRCARARRGRPTRPRSRAPRGARRRARRSRTARSRPARRGGRSRRRSSRRSRRAAIAIGRSRALHLATSSRVAIASSAASSSPIRTTPSSSAIVAGTAPWSRTACSSSRATSALPGRGRPWAISVDSSATTGPPAARASATSGDQEHRPKLSSPAVPQGPERWSESDSPLVSRLHRAGAGGAAPGAPPSARDGRCCGATGACCTAATRSSARSCGERFRHFMSDWNRRSAICWSCGAHERHRALWLTFTHRPELLAGRGSLLHFAPEWCLEQRLRPRVGPGYTSADLDPGKADRVLDLMGLALPDAAFGATICSHVLEHVEDDAVAMRELRRVLVPGGWAIVMVPLDLSRALTYEDAVEGHARGTRGGVLAARPRPPLRPRPRRPSCGRGLRGHGDRRRPTSSGRSWRPATASCPRSASSFARLDDERPARPACSG